MTLTVPPVPSGTLNTLYAQVWTLGGAGSFRYTRMDLRYVPNIVPANGLTCGGIAPTVTPTPSNTPTNTPTSVPTPPPFGINLAPGEVLHVLTFDQPTDFWSPLVGTAGTRLTGPVQPGGNPGNAITGVPFSPQNSHVGPSQQVSFLVPIAPTCSAIRLIAADFQYTTVSSSGHSLHVDFNVATYFPGNARSAIGFHGAGYGQYFVGKNLWHSPVWNLSSQPIPGLSMGGGNQLRAILVEANIYRNVGAPLLGSSSIQVDNVRYVCTNAATPTPVPFCPAPQLLSGNPPTPVASNGLVAQFFNNTTFDPAGCVGTSIVHPIIDFRWLTDPGTDPTAPDTLPPGVSPTNFSARWTGYIRLPIDGFYQFRITADDRAWMYSMNNNGVLTPLLNVAYPYAGISYPVEYTANTVLPITIEYIQLLYASSLRLEWRYGQGDLNALPWSLVPSSVLFTQDPPDPTPVPTQTPTVVPTNTPLPMSRVTIFFGGSVGTDPLLQGPIPSCQTPVWVDGSHPELPIPDWSIRYEAPVINIIDSSVTSGGKRGQVDNAFNHISGLTNPQILLIGYSAGADAALMFADEFVQTNSPGQIVALVMLGGTLTGYSRFRETTIWNSNYPPSSTTEHLYDEVVYSVLSDMIPVYAFDDRNGNSGQWWSQISPHPSLTYVVSSQEHVEQIDIIASCTNGSGTPPIAGGALSATNVNTQTISNVVDWLQALNIYPVDY